MFGDMMGLMAKLKEAKANAEKTKERLKTVLVDEKSNEGLLKVTVSASGRLKDISIDEALLRIESNWRTTSSSHSTKP